MSVSVLSRGQLLSGLLAAAAALAAALWVAVCAAAPELIWQGSTIVAHHVTRADLWAGLLVGLVLACFVEPAMQLLHRALGPAHARQHAEAEARHPLFVAAMALAFALASVCLHDAITAFVSDRFAGHGQHSGLRAALALTLAWAMVPFCVTLAWLGAGSRLRAIATGALAVASPWLAGWLFGWSWPVVVETAVPAMLILGLGYRRAERNGDARRFAGRAAVVGGVAVVWLAGAALLRLVGSSLPGTANLYGDGAFWTDARFYLGWIIGLLVAPSPPIRNARDG
ncbi:MAG TPA: hypothetical protein VME92_21735 [Acetobacteraceae bacterium]|nr:hypothetical protein [Acetobacteraceae bacterium]